MMDTLSIRHAQQLSAALAPLYAEPDLATRCDQFAAALLHLFGAEAICVGYFSAQGKTQFLGGCPRHLFTPAGRQALAQLRPQHPLYEELLVRGNTYPLRLTDFASARAFRRTNLHWEMYRAFGRTHHLIMGTPVPGGLIACAILRTGLDFTLLEQTLLAFVQPHVAALLAHLPAGLEQVTHPAGAPPALGLTRRETDILFHLTKGRADKEIGQLCAISPRTVQNHLHNIYYKLGVNNRTAASLRAVSWL